MRLKTTENRCTQSPLNEWFKRVAQHSVPTRPWVDRSEVARQSQPKTVGLDLPASRFSWLYAVYASSP